MIIFNFVHECRTPVNQPVICSLFLNAFTLYVNNEFQRYGMKVMVLLFCLLRS